MGRPQITAINDLTIYEAIEDIKKKAPPILYKYRPWQTDYQKSALYTPEIYFSAPNQVNDPFDVKLAYAWNSNEIYDPRFKEKLREQFPYIKPFTPGTRDFEIALDNFFDYEIKPNPQKWFQQNQQSLRKSNVYDVIGLFCTTIDPLSDTMWAYYGDNYKGICIGYDPAEIWRTYPCQLGSVFYSEKQFEFSFVEDNQAMAQFIDYFTKKSKWQHEKEYRYISFFENQKPRSIQLDKAAIKEVYVGSNIDQKDLIEIVDCLKTNYRSCVKLFKVVDSSNAELVREEIHY